MEIVCLIVLVWYLAETGVFRCVSLLFLKFGIDLLRLGLQILSVLFCVLIICGCLLGFRVLRC